MLDADVVAAVQTTRFHDLRWFPELDSTNRYLLEQARAGAPEGMVAITNHQVEGRGRQGRSWTAPPGTSVLASVLVRPDVDPGDAHLLSLAGALAVAAASRTVAGVDARLKWPNDVLVGGRKVAGVLAESLVTSGALDAVVIGFGVNVNWNTEEVERVAGIGLAATALNQATQGEVDRKRLLVGILLELDARISALDRGERAVIDELRQSCVTIGADVRVQVEGNEVAGTAVDVDERGALLVDTGDTQVVVTAGEAIHVR